MILISRFVALILSCSLAGCLGLGNFQLNVCFDRPFYINPLESDLSVEQLQSAADVWNDALGEEIVVLSIFMSSDIDVYFVDEIEGRPNAHGLAQSYRNEDGTLKHCIVSIVEDRISVNLVAHELGHCMGLRHDSEEEYPLSIMNPLVDYNDVPQFHHLLHLMQCPITEAIRQ